MQTKESLWTKVLRSNFDYPRSLVILTCEVRIRVCITKQNVLFASSLLHIFADVKFRGKFKEISISQGDFFVV